MALDKSSSSFNRRLSGAMIRPENFPRRLFATLLLEQAVWWGGQESLVAALPEITCPEITWPDPSEISRQPQGSATAHLKRFYIDNDAFVSETSFQLAPPLALRASYLERNLTGISHLAALGREALNLRLDESPIFGPAFVVYGELDLDLFGPEIEHNWIDEPQWIEDQQRFLSLGFTGSQGHASYGASYSFRGNKHDCLINRENDTESEAGHQRTELWARWQFDHLGV